MGTAFDPERVRSAYDAVATPYAAAFGDELDRLPADAALVDRLGAHAGSAPILELGAGVAPVARRLPAAYVVAADLAAGMLAGAPPGTPCVQADARWLPFRDAAFGAACMRYVLQHLPRAAHGAAVGELRRVMSPGALLVVVVHLGDGEVELTELLGHRFAPVGGTYHTRDEVHSLLAGRGFEIAEEHQRSPVAGEADTQRLSVLAIAA